MANPFYTRLYNAIPFTFAKSAPLNAEFGALQTSFDLVNAALTKYPGNDTVYVVAGKVGIGTATPAATLDVAGGVAAVANISITGSTSVLALNGSTYGELTASSELYLSAGVGKSIHLRPNGGLESVTLASSGKVGVGATEPQAKLHVSGGATIASLADCNTLGAVRIDTANPGVRLVIGYTAADCPIVQGVDAENGSRSVILQPYGGRLGLGVMPYPWLAGIHVLDIGSNGALASSSLTSELSNNSYFDGTNSRYKTLGPATKYAANSAVGSHSWYCAPSGAAGAVITTGYASAAMTLDSVGNLGLGGPSNAASRLTIAQAGLQTGLGIGSSNGTPASIFITQSSVVACSLKAIASALTFGVDGSTGDIERMRMDTSGTLWVGASTGGAGIQLKYSGGQCVATVDHVTGTAATAPFVYFNYGGIAIGSITQVSTNGIQINYNSDYRLKSGARPLVGSGKYIDSLRPTTFEWTGTGETDSGFLAHEFQDVSPRAVTGVLDEMQVEEYEISPATESEPAVMGQRTVQKHQAMQAANPETMANIIAELQSIRARLAALEVA